LAIEISLGHAAVELFQESEVAVDVDERGNDGLAGEIDARCAGGQSKVAFAADAGEAPVLDNERRAFDGVAVAENKPCAFEERWLGSLAADCGRGKGEDHGGECESGFESSHGTSSSQTTIALNRLWS